MPQVLTYQSVFHIISSFLERTLNVKKSISKKKCLLNALKFKNNHRIHMTFSGLFKVKVIMSWSVHTHRIHHFVETGNLKNENKCKNKKTVSKAYNKSGDYYECWICGMYYLGSVVSCFRNNVCVTKRKRSIFCFWF